VIVAGHHHSFRRRADLHGTAAAERRQFPAEIRSFNSNVRGDIQRAARLHATQARVPRHLRAAPCIRGDVRTSTDAPQRFRAHRLPASRRGTASLFGGLAVAALPLLGVDCPSARRVGRLRLDLGPQCFVPFQMSRSAAARSAARFSRPPTTFTDTEQVAASRGPTARSASSATPPARSSIRTTRAAGAGGRRIGTEVANVY